MTTLITGGTGFIGAEVVRILLEKAEKKPVVFDINPALNRLDDIAGQTEVVRGDLSNFSHVLNLVKAVRPSTIYHLGGMLSVPSDADPPASFRTNVIGTFYLLEAARLFEVPQVIFSSTIGTYSRDIQEEVITDYTLQRPELFYGATKVFCEHLGLFYKRKYGLDFRGVRYPSVVGPGVKTPGVVQYTSWVIEASARGKPFTIWVTPDTKIAVIYFKDAARSVVQLAEAPAQNIKMVNYLLNGPTPNPSAAELADQVRAKVPGAQIDFKPDMAIQAILPLRPLDDSKAREEWNWSPQYDTKRMVEDFLRELEIHPHRYV